jgi:hypothetical protein
MLNGHSSTDFIRGYFVQSLQGLSPSPTLGEGWDNGMPDGVGENMPKMLNPLWACSSDAIIVKFGLY